MTQLANTFAVVSENIELDVEFDGEQMTLWRRTVLGERVWEMR